MPAESKLTAVQKRIVARIARLHAKGEPLNITAVKRRHPKLMEQVYAVKPFWGWKRALDAAGIPYADIRIELTETVTCGICGKEFAALAPHIVRTHECTIKDYRLDYPTGWLLPETRRASLMRRCCVKALVPHWEPLWSPEYVLDRITELHCRGFDVNCKAVFEGDTAVQHAVTFFGSWDEALRRAGLDPADVRVFAPYREWTPQLLLERVRDRHAKGLPMHYAAAVAGPHRDKMLIEFARRFAGSWENALGLCGIDYEHVKNPRPMRYRNAAMVVDTIVERVRKGVPVNTSAVTMGPSRDQALYRTAQRHFGTWRAALAAAGVDYDEVTRRPVSPYPTRQDIIRALKQRARSGLPLSVTALRAGEHRDGALVSAVHRRIGKWSEALKAAGIQQPKWKRKSRKAAPGEVRPHETRNSGT